MTVMNNEFTYLYEIVYWLLDEVDFTHDEYNLSGSRYSGKTFSVAMILPILFAIALKKNKKVAIYGFRKLNKDINDLVKEVYESFISAGFQDYTDFNLKYPNKQADFRFKGTKSFIRVMGVYSNSNDRIPLKGLSRSEIKGFDLIIEWEEEANELTQQEFQAITFAIGNAKKRIKITTCNPDNIYQYHIEYMNNRVPYNLEIMKKNNEQIKSIIENNILKLFHYSNWKLNKQYLSENIINNLAELKVLDPIKAQSWYDGVPSVLTGAIFARILNLVKTQLDFQPYYFRAGLDIGMATSITGHPTSAHIGFLNQTKTKAHVYKEYFHSNASFAGQHAMQYKDTFQLAHEIINFYLNVAYEFPRMKQTRLIVTTDYGNGGQAFIDVANKILKDKYITWLSFNAVIKENYYIRDRIDWLTAVLIKGIVSIDWNNCPNTKRQLGLIQWLTKPKLENNNNQPQMLDLHDDTFDSICYMFMSEMRALQSSIGNDLLIAKKRSELENGFI